MRSRYAASAAFVLASTSTAAFSRLDASRSSLTALSCCSAAATRSCIAWSVRAQQAVSAVRRARALASASRITAPGATAAAAMFTAGGPKLVLFLKSQRYLLLFYGPFFFFLLCFSPLQGWGVDDGVEMWRKSQISRLVGEREVRRGDWKTSPSL